MAIKLRNGDIHTIGSGQGRHAVAEGNKVVSHLPMHSAIDTRCRSFSLQPRPQTQRLYLPKTLRSRQSHPEARLCSRSCAIVTDRVLDLPGQLRVICDRETPPTAACVGLSVDLGAFNGPIDGFPKLLWTAAFIGVSLSCVILMARKSWFLITQSARVADLDPREFDGSPIHVLGLQEVVSYTSINRAKA